ERICEPLVDPANGPKLLKDKLTKAEGELKELLRECELRNIPAGEGDIPWEKLLGTIARLVTYQRIVEASDRILDLVEGRCHKITDEYIETLTSLISSDNQMIAELESCLSTLSIQFEQ